MNKAKIAVIGAGLAGCEASWQIAKNNIFVDLYEMRPHTKTEVHKTADFAELVCSNSLGSESPDNASANLKRELRQLDSILLKCLDLSRIPCGQGLVADRKKFSGLIEEKLRNSEYVNFINTEITTLPDYEFIIIATGPLTSEKFSKVIANKIDREFLSFYDAVSPIIDSDTIDYDIAFKGSRYSKGVDSYLNCPMDKEHYDEFYDELIKADPVELKGFEKKLYFEACLPVEEMAKRGRDTLRFGPLKPVGFVYPATNNMPYAIVQLRPENINETMYNMVGFQTRLPFIDQKRVFRMIPGLEKAEFFRFGVMHKNIFINSPVLLNRYLQLKADNRIMFAGQITGSEGYVESIFSGWYAGFNASRIITGYDPVEIPEDTFAGALIKYITDSEKKDFQPMSVNFGLLRPVEKKYKSKKEKKEMMVSRAFETLNDFKKMYNIK